MSAEFKRDSRDGKLKFLEVNARPWWHFWLSAKCGVDILYYSYLDTIGEKIGYTDEYKTNVKGIYLNNDLLLLAHDFLNGNLDLRKWLSSLHSIGVFAILKKATFLHL